VSFFLFRTDGDIFLSEIPQKKQNKIYYVYNGSVVDYLRTYRLYPRIA